MIDVLSTLLLMAAEPEASGTREMEAEPEAESTAADEQQKPEPLDRTLGLATDDYPAESVQAREEGTVRIAVDVDPEGKPIGCTILQSSGHSRLDEKTCQVAMERADFRPARDRQGNPVASIWRSPGVVWRMPRVHHASLPPTVAYHATTIQIAADGTLGECTVETHGNMTIPDACDLTKARHAKNAKDAARWWKSLTDVVVTSNTDAPPNVGKAEWGSRQGRILSAQLMLGEMSKPVSCETILTEGWAFGGSACPPPDWIAPTPADADWSKARTNYTEFSTFAQPR